MASGKTEKAGYWFGKRALVTGGDGFVAANLAARLMRLGANVVSVVRHQRPHPTLSLLAVDPELQPDVEISDLSDFIAVQRLCNRHQIDTIFHLAASAIVSDAARAPISTLENNIMPTINLLEAARINKIPRVLIASSDKAYGDHASKGDREPLPYSETHALRGLDVYSASKVCADMISQTYALQFELPVLIARSCNVYGPGDLNITRVIPRTIMRILQGESPIVNRGNERVRREYIFVDDLVEAYLFLARKVAKHYRQERPRSGIETYGWAAYNIGMNMLVDGKLDLRKARNIRTAREVIEAIAKGLDKKMIAFKERETEVANFIEIPDQYLDSSKLHKLGFQPKTDFNDGLATTIAWYRENENYLRRIGDRYLHEDYDRAGDGDEDDSKK